MTNRPLRLFALDEEDLSILSAHVQDAVAKVSDVRWAQRAGQFSITMNRFAWERTGPGRPRRQSDERRRAVLHFDRVARVRVSGITPGDQSQVISILSVLFEATDAPAGVVNVVCSGNVVLRLDVECIEAQLTDVGAVWGASMRPKHVVGR